MRRFAALRFVFHRSGGDPPYANPVRTHYAPYTLSADSHGGSGFHPCHTRLAKSFSRVVTRRNDPLLAAPPGERQGRPDIDMASTKRKLTSPEASRIRRRAGLAYAIAIAAVLACLIPVGTETQGGGSASPPTTANATRTVASPA